MDEAAKVILRNHINLPTPYTIFITWKCKVLKNYKYLLCTNLPDRKYYELTYDGNNNCWYLDEYTKIVNKVIKEEYD